MPRCVHDPITHNLGSGDLPALRLARWINAPHTGLELIRDNVQNNHMGKVRGRWHLSIRSYRSLFHQNNVQPDFNIDRSMCTLTMNDNVFVLIEDPAAPTRAEALQAQRQAEQQPQLKPHERHSLPMFPHYRTTFLTANPPGALDAVLSQLRARWTGARQAQNSQGTGSRPGARNQADSRGTQAVLIDGLVFSIGKDWIVRAGNVVLPTGAIRGMLLEGGIFDTIIVLASSFTFVAVFPQAEYLPLPVLHSSADDGTSELLSNLLLSVLPTVRDAKTVAVTISDAQWQEVLWENETEEEEAMADDAVTNPTDSESSLASNTDETFVYGDEEDLPLQKKGDWVGIDRDRRSAYLIIGALKSEGIL